MKYLKKFENHSAYETAESSLILPNVSLCVQEGDVHYNPYFDPYGGHEYVDLGLPSGTKWATMNVGATSITDYGDYYKYGKGADTYQVTSGQSNYNGNEVPLALSADTAAQVWGEPWHMPTSAQCVELFSTANTTTEWTTIDGVNGYKFTAKNGSGNYIFIPAAGFYHYSGGGLQGVGNTGDMFTSTCLPGSGGGVWYITFNSSHYGYDVCSSGNGYAVRPVVG